MDANHVLPVTTVFFQLHGPVPGNLHRWPVYDAGDYKKVPYLDVSSVYNDKTSELIINVVNRHQDKAIETAISNQYGKLAGTATVSEVNSTDMKDENSEGGQKVMTSKKKITLNIALSASYYRNTMQNSAPL